MLCGACGPCARAHFLFAFQLIREILPVLYGFAVGNGIDVALCTIDRTVFAVMQAERTRWNNLVQGLVWNHDLSPTLMAEAKRLSDYALRDELALFLGAGVSIGAGLPSWGELLNRLAKVGWEFACWLCARDAQSAALHDGRRFERTCRTSVH